MFLLLLSAARAACGPATASTCGGEALAAVAVDPLGAAPLLKTGCSAGDALSCGLLEVVAVAGWSTGSAAVAPGPARSAAYAELDRACAAGGQQACYLEGVALEKGLGVTVNLGSAQGHYAQACQAGVSRACYQLGRFHSSGPPAWRDAAQAAVYFRQACQGGEADACYEQARTAAAGGSPTGLETAAGLYQKGCDEGHAPSCRELGLLMIAGKAGADPARGKALLEQACKAGDSAACGALK